MQIFQIHTSNVAWKKYVWFGCIGNHWKPSILRAFYVRTQVVWKTPENMRYLPRTVKKKKYYFGTERPWTLPFSSQNDFGHIKPKVFLEPIKEWSIFKGDRASTLYCYSQYKQTMWYNNNVNRLFTACCLLFTSSRFLLLQIDCTIVSNLDRYVETITQLYIVHSMLIEFNKFITNPLWWQILELNDNEHVL